MNKNTLIGLVIGLVAVAVGAVAITQNTSNDEGDNSAQTEQNDTSEASSNAASDNPFGLDLLGVKPPYQITLETMSPDGDFSTTIDVDKDNNTRTFIASSDTSEAGEQGEILLVDNISYTYNQDSGQWLKLPLGSLEGDSSDTFTFSDEDYEEFIDEEIADKGKGGCAAGTCRIYELTDEDGDVTILRIDDANNRISELESTDDGDIVKVTYNYDANFPAIEAPEDFTEFNASGL